MVRDLRRAPAEGETPTERYGTRTLRRVWYKASSLSEHAPSGASLSLESFGLSPTPDGIRVTAAAVLADLPTL